ncbi:MAG TPA: hypothetical protein VNC50_06310, partial [Planctomycetia bacterium]|nr:hypothetical protein [Planctomycetia bacterium]
LQQLDKVASTFGLELEGRPTDVQFRYVTSKLGETARLEEKIWLWESFDRRVQAVTDPNPTAERIIGELDAELENYRILSFLKGLMQLSDWRKAQKNHSVHVSLARGILRAARYARTTGKPPAALVDIADAQWPPRDSTIYGPEGPRLESTATGVSIGHPEYDRRPEHERIHYRIELKLSPTPTAKGGP